jgi:hypothetical protein
VIAEIAGSLIELATLALRVILIDTNMFFNSSLAQSFKARVNLRYVIEKNYRRLELESD